jgi:signal transduction histidine kinase
MVEAGGRFPWRWRDWQLRTKGLAVVAVPLVALALAGAMFAGLQQQDQRASQWVNHTNEVRLAIKTVTVDLVNAETGVRGYLLIHQADFLQPYQEAQAATTKDIRLLADLVRDNPPEEARAQQVTSLAAARLANLQTLLSSSGTSSSVETGLLNQSKTSMDAVRTELGQMDHVEVGLLAARTAAHNRLTRLLNLAMAVVIGLGLAGGVAASLFFARGIARRVKRLQENAGRLQDELPLTDLPSGHDEVGRLAASLERASVLLAEKSRGLQAQAALVRRERLSAVGEMTTVIGHELRNPLGAVINLLFLARSGLTDQNNPELDGYLDRAESETNRAAALSENLIAFMQERDPVIVPLELRAVVDEVLRLSPAPPGIEVCVEDLGSDVQADRGQLVQILTKLITNAYQAMPDGGRLGVGGTQSDGFIEITVEDSGVGIDPAVAERLLEPFFTTKPTGTGLGLAIVKRFTEGHNGTVSIENGPTGGARVTIRLPHTTAGVTP